MRNQNLAPFTTYELLEEIRDRFQELEKQRAMARLDSSLNALKKVELAIPAPESALPKGIVKVEEIPGRFNRDGSPRKLLTAAIPKELEERLTVTPAIMDRGVGEEFDGRTQFIVKGPEREALANAMIQAWRDEIAELEARLESLIDEDEVASIKQTIRRLEDQIATRSSSAFGGMSAEQARAQNLADNGNIQAAPSEAGVPGRGIQFTMASGLKEWDAPLGLIADIIEEPHLDLMFRIQECIADDSICGHVPDRFSVKSSTIGYVLRITMEPSVVYRVAYHGERLCTERKEDPKALLELLADLTKDHHVRFSTTSDGYRRAWTGYLQHLIAERGSWSSGDPRYMSLKRAIRILNADFQEKEIPDSYFDQQSRRGAPKSDVWNEVESGPGVFRMSRVRPEEGQEPIREEPARTQIIHMPHNPKILVDRADEDYD